jgi:hypothetical protein
MSGADAEVSDTAITRNVPDVEVSPSTAKRMENGAGEARVVEIIKIVETLNSSVDVDGIGKLSPLSSPKGDCVMCWLSM